MPDDANEEVTSSIAAKFSDCLGSYRQLYFLLTSRHVRGLQEIDLTEVSDNYGRLNVWGADSGALRIGRGSLDDILRTNENLRSIILDLLEDLLEAIGRAILAFQESEGVSPHNDPTPYDDHQDSESNTSTASEQSGDGESGTRRGKNNGQFLISIILGHIRSLYKLSRSLRRFTVHEDHSLSFSKYADASHFASSDQKRIENRFPNAAVFLVDRLCLANTRRRQQLQYWKEHHEVPSQAYLPSSRIENSESISQEIDVLKSTPWVSESGRIPALSLNTPSTASDQSLTPIAGSDLQDDTSLSEGRDADYAPSLPEKDRNFRIPDVQKVLADHESFECSYCHAQLDTATMAQRGVWKRHVFRDLRPYVCTYQDCPNTEKMYISRHEWLQHEQQMHQRSWICWNGCKPIFKSAQLLRDHILHRHSGEFIESQLPVLLDMCERAADPDEKESCSLCGQQMNLITLRHHVASHLEDIALFALPRESDQSETDASSGRASHSLKRVVSCDNDGPTGIHVVKENEGARDPAVSQHTKAKKKAKSSIGRKRPKEKDISCLVLYEPLALDYSKQSRRLVSDGGDLVWVPPNHKDAYLQDEHRARLFRWLDGRMTDITTEAPHTELSLYSVATVFIRRRDKVNILAVPFDARKKDVTEDSGGWKYLNFEYTSQNLGSRSYVAVELADDQRRIALPLQTRWMKLLPAAYFHKDPDQTVRPWSKIGLIGSLPLLFALPAFSAQPDQLSNVLTEFLRLGIWFPHELPHGYDDERGMVVSVFLDPDNKECSTQFLLDYLQDGAFGPFYGG